MIKEGNKEKRDNKKSISNKKKLIKRTIISIALIMLAVILLVISKYMQTTITVSYKEQSDLDYKVYLKKNNYYEARYLEKNMYYIANLIDYIDIHFNYNFKVNQNMDYTYKYYIVSELNIFERSKPNNIIFKKREKLVEDIIEGEENSDEVNINKNIIIDYGEYNNLGKMFKADYNISADSNLKITIYIELNGIFKKFEYPIKINNPMEITIPLTEQIINISTDYKESDIKDESVITYNRKIIGNILLGISSMVGILAIISIIKLIVFIYNIINKKSVYEKTLKKILKGYDRVIAKVEDVTSFYNEEKVIEVIKFEQLLGISDRLGKPILLIEVEKNKKSWFIVKDIEEIYVYILEEEYLGE